MSVESTLIAALDDRLASLGPDLETRRDALLSLARTMRPMGESAEQFADFLTGMADTFAGDVENVAQMRELIAKYAPPA